MRCDKFVEENVMSGVVFLCVIYRDGRVWLPVLRQTRLCCCAILYTSLPLLSVVLFPCSHKG